MKRPAEPKVSIVLPVYNGEKYLREAVQSCLNQSYRDFELICVDDASTDRSAEILTELAQDDPRVLCVRHDENRKLPAALNTGFEIASGRYFTWTSDDNLYAPEAIERMVQFLETNSEVDLVYTAYRRIDDDGREIETVMPLAPAMLFARNVIGACFLYRQEVHQEIGGYRQEMFLAEDYDFWIRAALRFRLQPLDEVLYTYRSHGGALGQVYAKEVISARREVLADALESNANGLNRSSRARLHLAVAQSSATLADTRQTRESLAAAIASRPFWSIAHAGRMALITGLVGADRAARLRNLLRLKPIET